MSSIPTPIVETLGLIPSLLGEGMMLVSWWKPLVLLVPLVAWARLVSAIFDKHAARFFLPRKEWNLAHLIVGVVAFGAALAIPARTEWAFWAGFGVMVVILAADIAAFMIVANRDERVPEAHHLRLDFSKLTERRAARDAAKRQGTATLAIAASDKTPLTVPDKETPEFEVRVAAESLYIKASELRASQIDIAPTGNDGAYGVAYLVDGIRQPGQAMGAPEAIKIIDLWKAGAKLDVGDRRRKLVGDLTVDSGAERHKVRLTSSGGNAGVRLTMLMDPEKAVKRKVDDMGLLEPQLAELRALVEAEKGVVVLAAPPDGGRTTTLYSLLKMHDAYTSNVQTIEVEPQDSLEGIRQNRFDPQAEGAEFSTLVRSILRRDPDVVGVAELPDVNTAKEISRADQERTRTYVSIRADNAIAAVQAWVKAVGDPEQAANVLHGVLAQKLLRKLCVNCRMPYQPSGDMLKKLGLPADKVKQLFKKGGQVLIKNKEEICPVCRGVGYVGQDGLFEVHRVGPEERAAIKAGNLSGLKAEFRKKGLPTIQQAALRKAIDGVTSVEEVMRVTMEAATPPAAQPARPTPRPAAGPAPTAS